MNGDAIAQFDLGLMYDLGEGVAQDYAIALIWYRKAAEQGEPRAQNGLAVMYANGLGVTQDYSEAIRWWRNAAEQGEANGEFGLGQAYAYGLGVAQDDIEARRWFRRAAERGHSGARDLLKELYSVGEASIGGEAGSEELPAPISTEEGTYGQRIGDSAGAQTVELNILKIKAEQGNAEAQFYLGRLYDEGLDVSQDYTQALIWYRKAAEQGEPRAQNGLGIMYANGLGVSQDYSEAIRWWRNAAEQGEANGEFGLGQAYAYGLGVAQDDIEARRWFRRAAERGHGSARDMLIELYSIGEASTGDEANSEKWAAAISKEIDFGTIEDSVYRNEYFGMTVSFPPDWSVQDQRAQNDLIDAGAKAVIGDDENLKAAYKVSELRTVYLFMLFKHPIGTPGVPNAGITCAAERIRDLPGIASGKDYLFQMKKALQAGQFKTSFPEAESTEEIGGRLFDLMHVEMQIGGMTIRQKNYATIMNGYALTFLTNFSDPDQESELDSILSTVEFHQRSLGIRKKDNLAELHRVQGRYGNQQDEALRIIDNLRSLAAGAQTLMIETGVAEAGYSDIVGEGKPVSRIEVVAGEKYDDIHVETDSTRLSVTTADGRYITYDF